MCANFKPLTHQQLQQLNLPEIHFEYQEEVYPTQHMPLLFKSIYGLEWRKVLFGLVPKWAQDKKVAQNTYNARQETVFEKKSFSGAVQKCQFAVIPVTEFYETKYIDCKPQRWAVRRKDRQAFYIAALYEICKINQEIIRSSSMLTMDAITHPMMKDFHEPGPIKRSIIIIPHARLDEWLSLKQSNIHSFVEGFPVDEFECLAAPKMKIEKVSPQLNFFDF